jgi:voltage-gated potassium channel
LTSNATPPEAPHETRLERRLENAVDRATTPRGAAVVIASASIVITVASALLMTIVDRENYPSFGSGLWWAIQTTTTVGYGDNVPTTFAGRFIAAVVMMFGIGFLTVITAAITSTFVARSRLEQERSDPEAPTAEHFRQFDSRLERIEASLSSSSPPQRSTEMPTAEHFRRLDERLDRIESALTRPS